ncbi:MAG: hypothetical protein ACPG5U_11340, partial [Planktomarina sp.]
MERLFIWLLRLTFSVLVAVGLVMAVMYLFLSRSLPDYDDKVAVRGLSAEVEIVRDNANVPH